MTRKDYELIASVFYFPAHHREDWSKDITEAWEGMIYNMADALEQDNPKFDRDRFLKACGIDS